MNIPLKISQREKKFLLVGGVIVFLILIYQIVTWYRDITVSTREYIDAKQITYQKQLNKISEEEKLLRDFKIISAELKDFEKGLLSGNKPPVAAAEIQRILKSMALSLMIEIKSERALNPVDSGLYLGIPVEIGFRTSTAKLKDMLYKIKTSTLLLTVTGFKIRVTNITNPVDVYTTLIVKGFIKKQQMMEKVKNEGKNAS